MQYIVDTSLTAGRLHEILRKSDKSAMVQEMTQLDGLALQLVSLINTLIEDKAQDIVRDAIDEYDNPSRY